jgi:hypothetical protein
MSSRQLNISALVEVRILNLQETGMGGVCFISRDFVLLKLKTNRRGQIMTL